jgi:transposase-like protein
MARHRSFSSEFKRQLAREFLEGRAGMHELARRYSLSRNLIRLWVCKYEAGEFTDERAEAVRIAEYEHKIAELERKVGQLTMEVDLLKKGARLGRAGNDANYSIVSGPAPLHRARMPTHEARTLNLLLPPAPTGRSEKRAGEANRAALRGIFALWLPTHHSPAAYRGHEYKSQDGRPRHAGARPPSAAVATLRAHHRQPTR